MNRLLHVVFLLLGTCLAGGHALRGQQHGTTPPLQWQPAAGPFTAM